VQFYRNGDRFFGGLTYAVSRDRYRTLDSLMSDLTDSPLGDKAVLPKGVRHIFSLDGSIKVTSVDQLVDGMCYVCASTPVYRKVCVSPHYRCGFWSRSGETDICVRIEYRILNRIESSVPFLADRT